MTNTSGITPVEYNVLIKQDAVEETTRGGLYIPEENRLREKHGQTRGVIVAVADMAFNGDVWPDEIPRPEPGQRIVFAKHTGTFVIGLDDEEYRIIKDKDVVGLIDG